MLDIIGVLESYDINIANESFATNLLNSGKNTFVYRTISKILVSFIGLVKKLANQIRNKYNEWLVRIKPHKDDEIEPANEAVVITDRKVEHFANRLYSKVKEITSDSGAIMVNCEALTKHVEVLLKTAASDKEDYRTVSAYTEYINRDIQRNEELREDLENSIKDMDAIDSERLRYLVSRYPTSDNVLKLRAYINTTTYKYVDSISNYTKSLDKSFKSVINALDNYVDKAKIMVNNCEKGLISEKELKHSDRLLSQLPSIVEHGISAVSRLMNLSNLLHTKILI